MFRYKMDIMQELADRGYKFVHVRQLFGYSTLDKIRKGQIIGIGVLQTLCTMLDCQPGDILEYEKTDDDIQDLVTRFASYGRKFPPDPPKPQKDPNPKSKSKPKSKPDSPETPESEE